MVFWSIVLHALFVAYFMMFRISLQFVFHDTILKIYNFLWLVRNCAFYKYQIILIWPWDWFYNDMKVQYNVLPVPQDYILRE
jgi:hypothetical protein